MREAGSRAHRDPGDRTAEVEGRAELQRLVDGLGRRITYLRVSVTEQCNLACVYCKPRTGRLERSAPPAMGEGEVIRLIRIFTGLGIRKVRLTGGEPLMRPDLETIVAAITEGLEGRVHLTTNGVFLPKRAAALKAAGLGSVNISLDAADAGAFARLTRSEAFSQVMAGLEACRSAGLRAKLNVVVLRGWNDDQIVPLARMALREPVQVRFIEFMPYKDNGWRSDHFMSAAEILDRIRQGLGADLVEEPQLGLEEGPARLFLIPGALGKVGVISPLSADFCDRCNRIRLTSAGELKDCLFGASTVPLLEAMRNHATDEDLSRLIRQAVAAKQDCHPMRDGQAPELAQGMWQVGG